MKTSKDPRHIGRVKVMQELFEWQFLDSEQRKNARDNHQVEEKPLSAVSQSVIDNLAKIDSLITEAAPAWPIEKINKIDLAVLRLAVYELSFAKKAPEKVIVDEAVELAKEYGSETSSGFINGVLGTLIEKNNSK